MKKFILFVLVSLVSFSLFAQEVEPLSFSKVIQADNAKKEVIYAAIMDWITTNYFKADNDEQFTDKEAGLIIKQVAFPYDKGGMQYTCYRGTVYYKLKFQIKDDRFKVELVSFRHEVNPKNSESCRMGIITTAEECGKGGLSKKYHNNVWNDIKLQAEEKANTLFEKMEGLKFDSFSTDNNEDW